MVRLYGNYQYFFRKYVSLGSTPHCKEYSLSPDWDNSWRFGGNLEEVIDESHLSAHWQSKAIQKFANERKLRIDALKKSIPEDIFDKMGIE